MILFIAISNMYPLCEKCGKELSSETAKFCGICGAKQTFPRPVIQEEPVIAKPTTPEVVNKPQSNNQQNNANPEKVNNIKTKEKQPVADRPVQKTNQEVKKDVRKPTTPVVPSGQIEDYVRNIQDTKLRELLYPFLSKFTYGLKTFFIGNSGSKKEDAIEVLEKVLKDTGHISKDKSIEIISFNSMPMEFENDRLYVISDLQTAINYLFNLDDFSNESAGNQRKYQEMLERLIEAPNSTYIVLNGTNVEYKGFITLDPRLPFLYSKALRFDDLTSAEVYDVFYDSLPEEYLPVATDEYKSNFINFLNKNRKFYPFNNKELAHYLVSECARQGELTIPENRHQEKSLEELFSSIIGMDNVKKKLVELNNYLSARVMMESYGAKLPPFNLNMMFLGNPGVGKTTIARIIAKILFDLGYTREEKLVECTSKDLVSAYSGLTGVKTNRVINRAMGGVLFIDEAYALSNSCGQAGAEAIAILIKAMEDFKGELVVMFAGYTAEMDDFVKSNSGIESRISYNFFFADYSTDELMEIFLLKLGRTGMTITEEGKEKVYSVLRLVTGRRNFGNGRFVDKMLQAVLTKHASLNLPPEQIMTLTDLSIPKIDEIMQSIK